MFRLSGMSGDFVDDFNDFVTSMLFFGLILFKHQNLFFYKLCIVLLQYTKRKIYLNITPLFPTTPYLHNVQYCIRTMSRAKKGQHNVNNDRRRACFVILSSYYFMSIQAWLHSPVCSTCFYTLPHRYSGTQ